MRQRGTEDGRFMPPAWPFRGAAEGAGRRAGASEGAGLCWASPRREKRQELWAQRPRGSGALRTSLRFSALGPLSSPFSALIQHAPGGTVNHSEAPPPKASAWHKPANQTLCWDAVSSAERCAGLKRRAQSHAALSVPWRPRVRPCYEATCVCVCVYMTGCVYL